MAMSSTPLTRPFDYTDGSVQTQWEPLVPNVTMNLYKEGTAADWYQRQLSRWLTQLKPVAGTIGLRASGPMAFPTVNCPRSIHCDSFTSHAV